MPSTLQLHSAENFQPTESPEQRLALANDADPRQANLDGVQVVELHFPKFSDGRAFSQAFLLRRRLGFTGQIRATGDVLVDQLPFMRRCGFDSFAPDAPIDAATLRRALDRYTHHYQAAADPAVPVWKMRHG